MAWQVYWIVIVLVVWPHHQARDGCHGAPLGDSSASGAGNSFVALDLNLNQGAQRDFDLFYPTLEETTATTPTTVEEETSYAVPVIHLPAEETDDDIEKVAADAILSMFPQDLLENNKKVRPVDVKIIEHDGYIDYEIEFIELAEYYEDYNPDNLDGLEIQDTPTEKPSIDILSAPELTFVDLLMEARKQHRKKENKTGEEAPISTGELRETVKSPIEEQTSRENPNKRRKNNSNNNNNDNSSNSNAEEQLTVSERSEAPPATEPERVVNTVTPGDDQETSKAEPTTTISPPQLEVPRSSDTKQHRNYENIQIADKEESVASVPNPDDDAFDRFTEDFQISESRSRLSVYTSSETPETTETNYDYYEVEITTDMSSRDHQDDFSKPERRPKVIRNEKQDDERQNILIKNLETKDQTEAPAAEDLLKGYYQHDATGDVAPPYIHDQRGQYKEIHPGQYSEIHPGQYEETHPGQYTEVNPGQYTLDDKDIEVDVNNRDNESRIYNVRANAGDFIIGEAGRIDINSGQTLEGVRYTAVESEVDYEKIKEILARYFGAR